MILVTSTSYLVGSAVWKDLAEERDGVRDTFRLAMSSSLAAPPGVNFGRKDALARQASVAGVKSVVFPNSRDVRGLF